MEDVTQGQWDTNPNPAPSLNMYIYFYVLMYKVTKQNNEEGNYCMCKLQNRNKIQRCLILIQLPGNAHTNPVCVALMELPNKPHSLHYSLVLFHPLLPVSQSGQWNASQFPSFHLVLFIYYCLEKHSYSIWLNLKLKYRWKPEFLTSSAAKLRNQMKKKNLHEKKWENNQVTHITTL